MSIRTIEHYNLDYRTYWYRSPANDLKDNKITDYGVVTLVFDAGCDIDEVLHKAALAYGVDMNTGLRRKRFVSYPDFLDSLTPEMLPKNVRLIRPLEGSTEMHQLDMVYNLKTVLLINTYKDREGPRGEGLSNDYISTRWAHCLTSRPFCLTCEKAGFPRKSCRFPLAKRIQRVRCIPSRFHSAVWKRRCHPRIAPASPNTQRERGRCRANRRWSKTRKKVPIFGCAQFVSRNSIKLFS